MSYILTAACATWGYCMWRAPVSTALATISVPVTVGCVIFKTIIVNGKVKESEH